MIPGFLGSPVVLLPFVIWSLIWKGLALWRSAQLKQRNWFIALLIINIFGALEILYLFIFANKPLTIDEIRSWFASLTKSRKGNSN